MAEGIVLFLQIVFGLLVFCLAAVCLFYLVMLFKGGRLVTKKQEEIEEGGNYNV